MFGSFRQPKKSEKTRQASPYETRNAKKAKNTAEETSLAAEIATVTQTRHNNNNKTNASQASVTQTRATDNKTNASNASANNNNNNNNNNPNQATNMEVETPNQNPKGHEAENPNSNHKDTHREHTEEWSQVSFKKRHTIYVDAADCVGDTQADKRSFLEEEIDKIALIIGISTKKIGEAHTIKVDLATEEDKTAACQLLDGFKIAHRTSAKGKDLASPEPINRSSELVVMDIPLGTTKEAINKRFSTWGNITQITLLVNSGWQTAHITYSDSKALEPFHTTIWSVSLKKDSLRIIPGDAFQDIKEKRNNHVLKLCNLPRGTTAFDISDYIKEVGGKTCFIPRSRNKYERMRYAFIAFDTMQETEALLQNQKPIYLKDNHVMWLSAETKTCHICQGKEHLAANCPRIQERGRNERRILRISELYKRKRVNADNVSTIHRKADAISQKKSYLEAAKGTSTAPTDLASIVIRMTHVEEAIINIQTILKELIKKGSLTEKTPKPNTTTPPHQKAPPKVLDQHTLTNKTPERSSSPNKTSKNSAGINASIHNPSHNTNTNTVNVSELVDRMDTFEGNVNKILHILSQFQATTSDDHNNDQDVDIDMETQASTTISQ